MSQKSRAGAFVVLAILMLAGCAQPQADDAEDAGGLTMAPGTTAHMLLDVAASGDAASMLVTVRDDDGLQVLTPDQMHGNGTRAAGWLGLEVPPGTPAGDREVVLEVGQEDGAPRRFVVTVAVEHGAEPLGAGTVALLDLVFRTADGAVAATTLPAVDRSPLPRTEEYQAPAEAAPQPVALTGQSLPPALLGPLANATVGQSLTLELTDYFGPPAVEQVLPRHERLPRYEVLPRFQEVPRAAAEQQGLITADSREGDRLETSGPLPYVVETLNGTTLRVALDLSEGDRPTMHPAWPDATVVSDRNGTSVTLRTDPPVQEGDAFTWNGAWPDATTVDSINETEIVLRHSPPVGSVYADPQQPGVQVTVMDLGEDSITVSRANPHPLAGQVVFAEVTVVGVQDAPEPGVPGGPSQG